MAPRLKVFVTSDGLTDHVVATTAKALAAWGSRQDLFETGVAHRPVEGGAQEGRGPARAPQRGAAGARTMTTG